MLDAARECVLAVGVRRTTLTDVARRAGVSRMTVYRRFPDVDTLVRELMSREFRALLAASRQDTGGQPHARARLVAETVAAVRAAQDNALFRRVVDVDPELLLPYLFDRLGGSQRAALKFLAEALAEGQGDGSVRPGDVEVQAHALLLAVQSFVLSSRSVSGRVPPVRLLHELATLLDRYLAPAAAPTL